MCIRWQSNLQRYRVGNVTGGVMIVIYGYFTFFYSSWSSYRGIKPYQMCYTYPDDFIIKLLGLTCPHIAMEIFFLIAITLCTLFSTVICAASFGTDLRRSPIKQIDIGCHAVGALLLLIGGILFIVSAVQVEKVLDGYVGDALNYDFDVFMWPKVAAGVMGIAFALNYVITMAFIFKDKSDRGGQTVMAYSTGPH